jgi:hypothetical protein
MPILTIVDIELRIAGVSLLALALLHTTFPRRFNWTEELAKLSPLNRQMFRVHCFFVALTIGLNGVLCLFFPSALTERSQAGLVMAAGWLIFWFCRSLCQFFVYDSKLWRNKPFETGVHVAFGLLWLFYVQVFASALLYQLRG